LLPGNLTRKEKMKCSLCEEKELQQTRGMVAWWNMDADLKELFEINVLT